jgi:hypothetical protein
MTNLNHCHEQKTIKIDDKWISLSLNLKHETKNQDNKTKAKVKNILRAR